MCDCDKLLCERMQRTEQRSGLEWTQTPNPWRQVAQIGIAAAADPGFNMFQIVSTPFRHFPRPSRVQAASPCPRRFPRFPLQRDAEFHWAQRQRGALLGGRPLLCLRDHRQLRVRRDAGTPGRAMSEMAWSWVLGKDMAWI
jgi:hypothetical protein